MESVAARKKIKFFEMKKHRTIYRPSNDAMVRTISTIGWEPLFSDALFKYCSITEQRQAKLEEFIYNYDYRTHSSSVGGVQISLTRGSIVQAFGFKEAVAADDLRKVASRGDASFRCELLRENAVSCTFGMPLSYVKDAELRRILTEGNVMLTWRPTSRSSIKFGVLQAVWESLRFGFHFDWPAFLLRSMTSHFGSVRRHLGSNRTMLLCLGPQLMNVIEHAEALAQVAAGPLGYPNAELRCSTAGDCDGDGEGGIQGSEGGGVLLGCTTGEGNTTTQEGGSCTFEEAFEELLLLIKRNIAKLLAARSIGSSGSEELQQMDEMKQQLHKLIVEAGKMEEHLPQENGQQLDLLKKKLEAMEVENAAQKEELCRLREESAFLRTLRRHLEDEILRLRAATTLMNGANNFANGGNCSMSDETMEVNLEQKYTNSLPDSLYRQAC